MARRKRRRNKSNKGHQLFGTDKATGKSYWLTLRDGTLFALTAIAAAGAGAAVGKHSLVVGIPVMYVGTHLKNNYILAAGLGMMLSNGFQAKDKAQAPSTTEGIGALDFKQLTEEAKERVSTFFKTFSEKLYLPKSDDEGTAGLGNDEVTYFVNHYSTKELDMSAIDRIQEQIAQMQQSTSGLNEIEREF